MVRWLKFLLKFSVSIGLMAVLVSYSDWTALRAAFGKIGWARILAATAILLALTPLLAWRWRQLGCAIAVPFTLRAAIVIVLIGTFFNQVLPSAIGGDAVRIWLLRRQNVDLTRGLSSVLLDRLFALIGMLLIAAGGLAIWVKAIPPQAVAAFVCMGVAGAAAFVLFFCLPRIDLSAKSGFAAILRPLQPVAADFRKLILSPRLLAKILGVSVLIHVFVSAIFWMFARALGLDVTYAQLLVCSAVALIFSVIPVSAAGWGMREGALALLLGPLGVTVTEALTLSVAFGLASLFSGLPGMLLWLTRTDSSG